MKKLSDEKKQRAFVLRAKGFALSEIAKEVGVAESTASVWMGREQFGVDAQDRIRRLRIVAQQKANKTKQKIREQEQLDLLQSVDKMISALPKTKNFLKTVTALLYWAEGSKSGSFVSFINSDPKMIQTFLVALRSGFELDEQKFRGLVHLHEYHDKENTEEYWSRVSQIPLSQFSKSYLKPSTGKQKKQNYMGCFRVRYYDTQIANELTAIYTILSRQISA